LKSSGTIEAVKERLQVKGRYSRRQQRLTVAEKEMENNHTLVDYSLPWREVTVHLVLAGWLTNSLSSGPSSHAKHRAKDEQTPEGVLKDLTRAYSLSFSHLSKKFELDNGKF
jgi:hypothetical protein